MKCIFKAFGTSCNADSRVGWDDIFISEIANFSLISETPAAATVALLETVVSSDGKTDESRTQIMSLVFGRLKSRTYFSPWYLVNAWASECGNVYSLISPFKGTFLKGGSLFKILTETPWLRCCGHTNLYVYPVSSAWQDVWAEDWPAHSVLLPQTGSRHWERGRQDRWDVLSARSRFHLPSPSCNGNTSLHGLRSPWCYIHDMWENCSRRRKWQRLCVKKGNYGFLAFTLPVTTSFSSSIDS